MLAYHYSQSDNKEFAYHYAKLSGTKAVKSCSNREAFQYYRDALAILKEEPDTPENKRELLDLILLMTIPMDYLFYPEDSLAVLQEGVRLCEGAGGPEESGHPLRLHRPVLCLQQEPGSRQAV